MTRRDFIKSIAALTAGAVLKSTVADEGGGGNRDRLGERLPVRKLGATGVGVTMLGVGGAHVGGMTVKTEKEAQGVIEAALEGGVRFFETAEAYGDGDSEERFGRLLTPRYRDVIFLATKTAAKDAKTAREHLEGSLRRMKTERLDLWQMHSVVSREDVDERLKAGVLDVLIQARKEGKARLIGFTGHRNPEAHRYLLEQTDAFDSSQMAMNVLDPSHNSFIEQVLPMLLERKMGVQAMKTLAAGTIIREDGQAPAPLIPKHLTLQEALHFVWSLPVSVLVSGVDSVSQMRQNVRLARRFSKISEDEREQLVDKVAQFAGRQYESYKQRD